LRVSTVAERMIARRPAVRLPGHTLRLRLAVLYGSLFLASGAALLTITYILVARQYTGKFFVAAGQSYSVSVGVLGDQSGLETQTENGAPLDPQTLAAQAQARSSAALHQLLIQSGVALAIMAVISICLGWLIAGRALRPLRAITSAAREISASDLHRRLALDGPDDEIHQLGSTFNGLLERLETSFAAQRQFVANASHELRTPLTLERTLVEVALANPDATVDTLRATCERVLAASGQQERLIEALLTLSRSQRGLDHHEAFDLAEVSCEIIGARALEAERRDVRINAALSRAQTSGDPRLGERLIANLVDNAIRHNVAGGRVEVTTTTVAGNAVLTVVNTGPPVPAAEIGRLLQPFQRLADDRAGDSEGLGLGLSIAQAIAAAHEAVLTVRARRDGGLAIEARFPPPV
jgi:signal transduction histidine kinase